MICSKNNSFDKHFFVGTVGSLNVAGAGLTQVKAWLTWQTFEFDSDQ